MDIHKPKPWQGWREFGKELATIVLGVLIALGAEQSVEALHTARKAAEAEELVREEFARNVAFAQERVLNTPCIRARYQLVEQLLLATPLDQPAPRLNHLSTTSRPFSWRQWETAVASGAADHFPVARRLAYQRLYVAAASDPSRTFSAVGWAENQAIGQLEVLTLASRKLDAGVREHLLELAAQADADEIFLARNSRNVVDFAGPLQLPPPKFAATTRLNTPEEVKACLDRVAAEAASLPPIPGSSR